MEERAVRTVQADVLVVGGGAAAERAAIEAQIREAFAGLAAIAPISDPAMRQDRYRTFEAAFSQAQRLAIAAYIDALPHLVRLDELDVAYLDGAVREYWHRYLA